MGRAKSKKHSPSQKFDFTVFVFLLLDGILAWRIPEHRNWFIAIGLGVFSLWFAALLRRYRISSSMARIDKMDGIEFERYLVRFFRKAGYKTQHVGGSGGDFGADLIIEKKGEKTAVQAKNYIGGKVGNDAVQQAVAGASYYDCERAMVVTNSRFTAAAKKQASGSNISVILWDRQELEKALVRAR